MTLHPTPAAAEPTAALRIRELHKRFGRFVALGGIDLRVPRATVYGLLGLNGAGKTTTLECALGLLRPDGGDCEILGCPARHIARLGGRVGVVFDRTDLHRHLSVAGNLRICLPYLSRTAAPVHRDHPDERSWRGVNETLRMVGLERVRGRRASKLSMGMARRLAVARALLGAPDLVVMDEPLAGLDTEGVERVIELIRTLNRSEGITFILSSHRLFEMQELCDRVGLIHEGRVLAEGRLADLLAAGQRCLVVRATPIDRAREILQGCDQVEAVRDAGSGQLEVSGSDIQPAAINESLVRAGIAVSTLVERRATLHALFRDLTGITGSIGSGAIDRDTAAGGSTGGSAPGSLDAAGCPQTDRERAGEPTAGAARTGTDLTGEATS